MKLMRHSDIKVTNAFRRSCFPPPKRLRDSRHNSGLSPMPFGVPASPPFHALRYTWATFLVTNAFRRSCFPPPLSGHRMRQRWRPSPMPFGVPASPPRKSSQKHRFSQLRSPMPFGVPASPPYGFGGGAGLGVDEVTNAFRRSCFPLRVVKLQFVTTIWSPMPFGVPASPPEWAKDDPKFIALSPMPFGVPASPPFCGTGRGACESFRVTNAFRRSCFPPQRKRNMNVQFDPRVTNAFRRLCFPPATAGCENLSEFVRHQCLSAFLLPPGYGTIEASSNRPVTNAFRRSMLPPQATPSPHGRVQRRSPNAFRRSCFPPPE